MTVSFISAKDKYKVIELVIERERARDSDRERERRRFILNYIMKWV